jgi:hypothetical protein
MGSQRIALTRCDLRITRNDAGGVRDRHARATAGQTGSRVLLPHEQHQSSDGRLDTSSVG